jgi:hypothetical protein
MASIKTYDFKYGFSIRTSVQDDEALTAEPTIGDRGIPEPKGESDATRQDRHQ